jgi:pantoate--beta-alanine ligase
MEKAALIYQVLQQTAQQIDKGERDFETLQVRAIEDLEKAGFKTDYFCICNADNLLPAKPEDRDLVILVTAAIGQTRLLDNIEISLW